MRPQEIIAKHKLSMKVVFIPFSQSRDKSKKSPTLNWRVTVLKADRPIIEIDFTAGSAHCPSYRGKIRNVTAVDAWAREQCIRHECETGFATKFFMNPDTPVSSRNKPILPAIEDVLYSLVSDAGALDFASFEDWSADYGYDPDSRKAEAIYQACLTISLKLRTTFGEAGLAELREAFQDY